ncbi:hypothetical protein CSC2_09020 [Clostridium zeae]|uniref:Uncharacterized protein n=1 Tax=Clostridium zeae TaxID=2759022 RepID=A0ABQ1E6H4_9CLOT|nr:hypothetical protein [Clostridium zeae]GFZ30376.1 hypothetical protein CSC2_09020 [Clostridium zeae]
MNQGQELFYNFFIERAMDDKKEEAKALLEESFAKQAAGTFDMTYLQEIMPKFFAVLKPESIEEVKKAMNHFSSTL